MLLLRVMRRRRYRVAEIQQVVVGKRRRKRIVVGRRYM